MPDPDEARDQAYARFLAQEDARFEREGLTQQFVQTWSWGKGYDFARAEDEQRIAALVEGVRALHNGHGGAYGGVFCYSACHALAALEEAESA